MKEYLEQGMLPNATERQSLVLPVKRLLSHWKRLELKKGVVCRNVQDLQIVTPAAQAKTLW